MSFKKTVRLSDNEISWLSIYGQDFHTALGKVRAGYIDHKDQKKQHDDILTQLERLEKQIEGLKQ